MSHPALGLALLLPAALLAAGVAWHDCVLLALGAVALHRLFLWRMDLGAPWDGWRAALRCIGAGVSGLLAAALLAAFVAGGLLGAWPMRHEHTGSALALAAVGALALCAAQPDAGRRRAEALVWALVVGAAALALAAGRGGLGVGPCIFSLVVAAALAWAGWRLAHVRSRGLLHTDHRH